MKVKVDLHLTKMSIEVANITGQLEIDIIAEDFTGNMVKDELLSIFQDKELEGTIFFDNEKVEL